MNIVSIYIYASPVSIHCHLNCTDLGLRSRTFSLKIYKLPTILKSLKHGNV